MRNVDFLASSLRRVFDAYPKAVVGTDWSGNITFVNNRALELFAVQECALVGCSTRVLYAHPGDVVVEGVGRTLDDRGVSRVELRRGDGAQFLAETTWGTCWTTKTNP